MVDQIEEYLKSSDLNTIMIGFELLKRDERMDILDKRDTLTYLGFFCPSLAEPYNMWYVEEKNEYGQRGYTKIGEL